ncbi:MAG TPA: nuclear transport factor 2 family protein [Candidatus Dormibacteraeota bacterium]
MSNIDVVRESLDAYQRQDIELASKLLADDFRFTSPQDDHIDKAAYLERCFPTADRFVASEVIAIVAAGDDAVLLLYEYELTSGERYRNTEYITVRHGKLVETQVFFGGRV